MDKVKASPADTVRDIRAGASIAVAGFGVAHRFPSSLIVALREQGTSGPTVYCNGLGQPGTPTAHLLAENKQIARLVTCFSARPGIVSEAERQIRAGTLELELVPQGTLMERMRAGGAGIPAFYTPAGVGTAIAGGKDVRYFDGRPFVLERAITTDFAFVRAHRADARGNLQLRGGSRNFNVSFAKAAAVTIAEVDEIVPVGGIPPEEVDLPGVFVSRVVRSTVQLDVQNLPMRPSRSAGSAREYGGKPGLTRAEMARRTAALLPDGATVNLGAGLPTLVSDFVGDRPVTLHSENGMLNYGPIIRDDSFDPDVHDAGGYFVGLRPGASFFDSVTSFEIARSGRLDAVVLGAYQVSARGDLANWTLPTMTGGGIGGAMDLAVGAKKVIALLEHTGSAGQAKLVERCEFELTAPACVDAVVTDLALLSRTRGGFRLDEVARGFTAEEVRVLTAMPLTVADDVRIMQDRW
ncbi:3-oxoacid CoA-transferase [Amycolatopsis acidiphila]|uniref:3-oxoacid CoA-transferase subunit A n=1 Tax=Amycolatopsis acidiphila TaxID=715473 RepID=A0A558A3D8_9PSEU|nr:3-oxoacid CoA-transferase [Amycolatopsis acidiphila]TVT18770.1 3-oxoacid CoA-transferase subunit A [Amycolatopsis acidiphila]UIJ56962.1 3-oxoacid CoA-transferase [Amycolatopsis acidiphila]GHG54089.1 succinyl-CoA--3-ketoacid-CoA transferase [Amycolatopsis acidiphila]